MTTLPQNLPLLVLSEDRLLGDAIMSLPAIKLLAENEVARYLSMANGDVQSLVPKTWDYTMPGWQATQDTIYRLNNYDVFSKIGQVCHPTEAYCRLLGLDSGPRTPEIHYTLHAWQPKYDYVLSINSATGGGREWDNRKWNKLAQVLGCSGKSVCVIGQGKYGYPFLQGYSSFMPDTYFDHPINDVCGVLAKAGTVITIDNGIGRLKHAIGGKHILIASDVVPKVWVDYPGCDLIHGDIQSITPDDVLKLCERNTPVEKV